MKSYGQFCPVAQALELLAERWTLLIVRELLSESTRFNEILRGVPQMSRTLLSQRLKTLEAAGVVERHMPGGAPEYHLTEAGEQLRPIVEALGVWGKHWAPGLTDEQLDPNLLMWDIHRRLDHDAITPAEVVVRFEFSDQQRAQRRYWLHIKRGEADVCLTNPGFDVDLVVSTNVRTLTEIWRGTQTLRAAETQGQLRLTGPQALRRAFPRWLQLSVFASA